MDSIQRNIERTFICARCANETKRTFLSFSMAAFSFFSHFLADLCICLDVMRRLTSSSSSDTLFPIVLGLFGSELWEFGSFVSSFERVCYWIWFRTGDAKVTRKSSLLFASGGSDEAAVVLLLVDQVLLCSFVRPSLHVASSAKQEGAAARPCLFFSRSVPHSRLLPIASSVPLNIERTLTRETEVWVFS